MGGHFQALHLAAGRGNVEFIEMLLQAFRGVPWCSVRSSAQHFSVHCCAVAGHGPVSGKCGCRCENALPAQGVQYVQSIAIWHNLKSVRKNCYILYILYILWHMSHVAFFADCFSSVGCRGDFADFWLFCSPHFSPGSFRSMFCLHSAAQGLVRNYLKSPKSGCKTLKECGN